MTLSERIVNGLVSLFFRLTCKVTMEGAARIPVTGPAIIIANHSSTLDGPFYYVSLRPRRTVALAKKELWDSLFTRVAMKAWGSIPLDRGAMDMKALRACFGVLDERNFLCIAPEGTRSRSGALKQARPGTALFATRRSVPIYPMVQWGLLNLSSNLRRLKRTEVNLRIGAPFMVEKVGGKKISGDDERKMADEMMCRLAELLPKELRGHYADESAWTAEFIRPL